MKPRLIISLVLFLLGAGSMLYAKRTYNDYQARLEEIEQEQRDSSEEARRGRLTPQEEAHIVSERYTSIFGQESRASVFRTLGIVLMLLGTAGGLGGFVSKKISKSPPV